MPVTNRRQFFVPATVLLTGVAAHQLQAEDLSGKWQFVWNTEGGIRKTVWMITQEGESLSVVSDGSKFEGTFTGNRMVIKGSLYSIEAGYGARLEVDGQLEDGVLKGKGTWDQYSMTFEAHRSE